MMVNVPINMAYIRILWALLNSWRVFVEMFEKSSIGCFGCFFLFFWPASIFQNIIPPHSWTVDWGKDHGSTCHVREVPVNPCAAPAGSQTSQI